MTDQELNEKLARWRWPDATSIELEPGPKLICITFYDKTYVICFYFTDDLNAIFMWLVPELQPIIIRISVNKDYNDTDKLTYCCELKRNMGLFVMSAWLASGEADTPSLALCKAIEQVIDNE